MDIEKYNKKVKDLDEALKTIPDNSYYERTFKDVTKTVINKKGAFHLKEYFGIKTELLNYEIINGGKGFEYCYHVFKATNPDGEFAIGFGGSDRKEFPRVHNAISTSATRSEIRAILELVAFGDLSAVELVNEEKNNEV